MARAMKDSGIPWIGEIPENWIAIKNKYLLQSLYSGGTPTASDETLYSDEGVPFVAISDMSSCDYVYDTKKKLTEKGIQEKNLLVLPEGTILYSIYATIGAVSELKVAATINQAILALTLYPTYDKQFYKYNLTAMRDYIFFSANGNTQFNLNAEKVWNFILVQPPFEEQKRIAAYLDTECARIDAVMEQTRASIEEYKKLKQSIITEAVTKGIRPNRPMKDSGIDWIGNVPSEWKIKKTKSLSKRIVVGVVIRPADFFDENGTVPFLRGINIKEYGIQAEPMVYINEATNQLLSKSIIHSDDILIVRDGSIGTTCVVPNDYDGANVVSLIVVSCNDQVSPQYLCYSFNSDVGKTQFNLTKIGTALTHTSVQSVSNIFHILPPHEEQFEIIEYIHQKITEIDSLVEKKNFLLTELLSYKKSLIFEYVTGKKEVGTI